MRANSIRRLAGGAAALMLAGATILSAAATVSAAPPRWTMQVTSLPNAVSPGANAGYRVVIVNQGPSNISTLFLVTNSAAGTTYVNSSRANTCSGVGAALNCNFGALTAGSSITVTVGYGTPTSGSQFVVQFQLNSNGATFSDVKGRSHGDTLTAEGKTTLISSKNFAGGFSPTANGQIVNEPVGGNNRQSTKIAGLPAGVAGTVEDGPGTTGWCDSARFSCSDLFGEWSVVNVTDGTLSTVFTISITFKTGTPSGFVHANSATDQELVGPCAGTTAPSSSAQIPCFTWSGNTATIYTLRNGSWRGL